MKHLTIAEFVDAETGERVPAGSLVDIADPGRVSRLVTAGVIAQPVPEPTATPKRTGKRSANSKGHSHEQD